MSQKRDSLDNLISKENQPQNLSDLTNGPNNQQPVEHGKQEAVKEGAKSEVIAQEKFNTAVSDAEKELFRTKSVSPLKLTYKEIIVDLHKVTIVDHPMPFTENIHTILIQDIKDIKVTSTPLLAAIQIIDNGPTPTSIDKLKKDDAIKIERIIHGIMLAQKQSIDLSQIKDESIVEKIEKLGTANL